MTQTALVDISQDVIQSLHLSNVFWMGSSASPTYCR